MTSIVFSKDRAMQLHAFLRSYQKHVHPVGQVHVLYTASSFRHQKAYERLFDEMGRGGWVVPCRQTEHGLKADLLELLPATGSVIFFVDDQLFIRPWQVSEEPGLSLHMAPHLTHSYTVNQPQPLPQFSTRADGKLEWLWSTGCLDWQYPLSLDAHVFDAPEMRRLFTEVSFNTPNSLESAMQFALPTFLHRHGVCYEEAKVVNVPWNRVQGECPNRFGGGPSSEEMLDLWEEGKQINLAGTEGLVNESVHQELEFQVEAR